MNSNQTVRDLTWTQHASVLNQVYPQIIASNKFQNFQMYYVPPDLNQIISIFPSSLISNLTVSNAPAL
jgi:hypothetical protein